MAFSDPFREKGGDANLQQIYHNLTVTRSFFSSQKKKS